MLNVQAKTRPQARFKRAFSGLEIPLQYIILALGLLASFLLPSPIGIYEENMITWMRIVQAVITVLLGITLLSYNYRREATRRTLWRPALSMIIISVLLSFAYLYLSYAWTCNYANTKVIIGSTLTADAANYMGNKAMSCEELIMDYAGDVEAIYLKESINTRRIILTFMYVILVPFFAAGLIAVLVKQKRRTGSELKNLLREDILEQKRLARQNNFADHLLLWLALLSSIMASSSVVTRFFSETVIAVLAAIPAATVLIRNTFKFDQRSEYHATKMSKLNELWSQLVIEKQPKERISQLRTQINATRFQPKTNPINLKLNSTESEAT